MSPWLFLSYPVKEIMALTIEVYGKYKPSVIQPFPYKIIYLKMIGPFFGMCLRPSTI